MTEGIDAGILKQLLEDWLYEVRVIRSRRTPARVRMKRKRYYRKRKARIKRMAKRRAKRPRAKRLAKRRRILRKRYHIKPGSRRRLRLAWADKTSNLMEGRMKINAKDLIAGFENVAKLVENLEVVLGKSKPASKRKLMDESFFPAPLPDTELMMESLDEDFASLLGAKKPAPKKIVIGTQLREDALKMVKSIKEGRIDADEAYQILQMMTEALDKDVEKVLVSEGKWSADADDLHTYAMNVEHLYNLLQRVKGRSDAEHVAEEIMADYAASVSEFPEKAYTGTADELASVIMNEMEPGETDEAVTEEYDGSGIEGMANEIALMWACDGIASDAENYPELSRVFTRSQEDIMHTVPSALEDAGLDIQNYLATDKAKELLAAINKEWEGKLTVEELAEEFGDRVVSQIALQAQGYGVGIHDDSDIVEYLEAHGVEDFDAHAYEAGYEQAMQAIDDYAKARGIELKHGDEEVEESLDPETRNLKESDPSLKPPKKWFDHMHKQVQKKNPDYNDEQVKNTIGSIWYDKLTPKKRSEIRSREGKEYGPAESVTEAGEGKWHIVDWTGKLMFDGQKFGSFDDAEDFLSTKLGSDYETDRGEYDIIPDKGSRETSHLHLDHPGKGKMAKEGVDEAAQAAQDPKSVKGKDMTPAKKAEMGKSLPGKFVRSGDTDTAKKIMRAHESTGVISEAAPGLEAPFELKPKLEAELKKYKYEGDVEPVQMTPEEKEKAGFDDDANVVKLTDKTKKELETSWKAFMEGEAGDKYFTEAKEATKAYVEGVLKELLGEKEFSVEVTDESQSRYVGNDAGALYLAIKVGDEEIDMEPDALFYSGAAESMADGMSSWNWLFWLTDYESPVSSEDFADMYQYHQIGQALEQFAHTLGESSLKTDIEKALKDKGLLTKGEATSPKDAEHPDGPFKDVSKDKDKKDEKEESVEEASSPSSVPYQLEILHGLLMSRGKDKESPEFKEAQKNASHDVSANKMNAIQAFKKAMKDHPVAFESVSLKPHKAMAEAGELKDSRMIDTVEEFEKALANGPSTFPGMYPVYFLTADGGVLSFEAAKAEQELIKAAITDKGTDKQWEVVAQDVNFEDNDLYCDHTGKKIPSAYGDDEPPTGGEKKPEESTQTEARAPRYDIVDSTGRVLASVRTFSEEDALKSYYHHHGFKEGLKAVKAEEPAKAEKKPEAVSEAEDDVPAVEPEGEPESEESHSYEFTDKESQIEALAEFLNDNAQWKYEYETEHVDAGSNYLTLLEPHVLDDFMNRGSDRNSEGLFEVIKKHLDRGLSKRQVWDVMMNCGCLEMKPCSIEHEPNAIEQFPVGEIEDQISGIYGHVNGKETNDMFKELSAGLSEEELKQVAKNLDKGYWKPGSDYMYINADYDMWAAVVDPEELDSALEDETPKKKMTKKSKSPDKEEDEDINGVSSEPGEQRSLMTVMPANMESKK